MNSRCFMFDLVILNIWIPEFDYQNNSISVDVTFNETEFTIESCPERPTEFKQGRTCEFRAYPDDLRNDLLERPLKMKIKCNDDGVVGLATVEWPKEMLDKLEGDNFVTFVHFDQCDIASENVNVGKICIQYRLRAKCELSETDEEDATERRCDIQDELKRIVSPNELFFLIQNDSDSCSVMKSDKRKAHCPTALDLSRFKSFHGKVVTNPDEFDQVYAVDCCHNNQSAEKKMAKPCHKVMSSTDNVGRAHAGKCVESQSSVQWACKAHQHVQECPHSNKFSEETPGSCSCDGHIENSGKPSVFQNGRMRNICAYPQSPPELKETLYIRAKLCPICQSDVSWLPKLAACPKCGHKPTPYAVEQPYNENLTADQILEEWADDNHSKTTAADRKPKRSARCTCACGKVCAFCRIRKLCNGVIKTKKCRDSNKGSSDSRASMNDTAPDTVCKSMMSEKESRAHLARVFSELRDLYNLKPEGVQQQVKPNKPCEKTLADRKRKMTETGSSRRIRSEEKPDLTKKMAPRVKARWCKGKIYNYKAVRKYPGTLIGHKACVCSGKSVPPNMGWLWNADTHGMRRGWRPGAIRKPIKEIMKFFLKDFPVDSIRLSKYSRRAVAKKASEELVQKPTLHICKKGGVYTITMRPLKEPSLLKHCADPYAEMSPIRFRIVKNPLLVYAGEMKKQLKKQFTKCTCHKPVASCFCRSFLDKKRLEFELSKACRARGIPSLKDILVLSDTSDSETEFDFGVTPPAGVIKPHNRHRPDLVCRETQYCDKDWTIKPKFPKPINKYVKPLNAIAGGRVAADGGVGRGGGIGPGVGNAKRVAERGKAAAATTGRGGMMSRSTLTEAYNLARERGGTKSFKVGGSVGGKYGSGKGADRNLDNRPPFSSSGYVLRTRPLMFNHLARTGKADPCAVGPCPCAPIC